MSSKNARDCPRSRSARSSQNSIGCPRCGHVRISPARLEMSVAKPFNATLRRRAANRSAGIFVSDESLRRAYNYKLKPTPEQVRELEEVLWRCRTLYNTALEQRITVYRSAGATLTCYQQQAELPDLKAAFPEYAAIHSQVLQDVLTRLDKTYQAFF